MSQAIVDPNELRRFAHHLKQFNGDLRERLSGLHAEMTRLSDTWRDQEHEKFTQEFEQTLHVIEHFLEVADEHVPSCTQGGTHRGIFAATLILPSLPLLWERVSEAEPGPQLESRSVGRVSLALTWIPPGERRRSCPLHTVHAVELGGFPMRCKSYR